MLRPSSAMGGLLLLALLTTVSPLLASSMNFEWPVDKVTGEPVETLELCKVDRKNHTRHAVAAAGGAIVAWQYTFRSFSYQLVEADTPMSWSNCLASCMYKAPTGYTMLITESEEENDVIRTLLVNSPDYNCTTGMGRSAWLAITDALDEGNMTYFMDGGPLNYTNWADHQPNDDNVDGQDCLRILASGTLDGKWEDIGCDIIWGAQQMCICRRDNKPSTTEARYLGVTSAGKKYWTLATPRSWEGCRMGCLREAKGRMAVAATPEDFKSVLLFAKDAAASLDLDSVWLGATDILLEGNWNWLDGTPVAADAPWAPEQPDNLRILQQKLDEDGLRLHTSGNLTGLYTDEYIGRMAACLCEAD